MSKLSSDLRTLGAEAYIYLYPLVLMDVTRQQMGSAPAGTRPGFGPPNQFHHLREYPPADMRTVVRPNFDTLYSIAWLDLTNGPVLVHVSDSDDRYYMLPMLDMWTDVFANPGKRTTGTGTQDLYVTLEGDDRPEPPGSTRIESPTPYAWIIGRTQTNGPADYAAVSAFQDTMSITPTAGVSPSVEPSVDLAMEPLRLINAMSASDFLLHATRCLVVNKPHATDFDVLARIAGLGIVPGEVVDPGRFDRAALAEIEAGIADARRALVDRLAHAGVKTNGWTTHVETMGVYGNNYLQRAFIALAGLGANPPADAIYPVLLADVDGEPLNGVTDYILHFDADALPPCDAFWSVTMYDQEGYQAANDLNRFAIGDRDPLTYNDDGSLDLYLQHASPGPDLQSNWLPAPRGPLGVTMRIYAPRPEALDGRWSPPPIRKN